MKKTPPSFSDPQVVAVLHRAGRVWRALVASARTLPAEVIAARHFSPDQLSRLDEWLDEHKAGAVLCVLPSSVVICRNSALPDATPEQLQQALHLQAEAHLLGIAPPHRLAMAVLPNAPGETTRTGLVLAWPEAAKFSAPPTTRPVTFVPDVAAIAAILNGKRPTAPVMWLDREDGSVALALTHAGGAIFRAVGEDANSAATWSQNIGRIAAETALSVGHTGAYIGGLVDEARSRATSIGPGDARLFMPAELLTAASARLKGVTSEGTWWSQYGVCAGALLARTGPLAPLTQLLDAPPIVSPSPVRNAIETLSRPQAAALVVICCVVILMFGPLAFSGLRLGILKLRYGDIGSQLSDATAARKKVEVYQELQKQRAWPMTKLLADITANTPLGIELETIRIESGKDFAVGGTALAHAGKTPAQLVAQFQQNLVHDGLFADVAVNSGKTDNLGRYKFDLSAKVAKPYAQPKLSEELDFALKPLKVRLYGHEAADLPSPTNAAQAPDHTDPPMSYGMQEPPIENPPDQPIIVSGRGSSFGGAGDDPTLGGDDMRPAPSAAPPPIDVEQLKVMSKAELKDALAKVARARLNRDLEDDVKSRLKQEHELIMEHLRKASS